MTDTQKDDPQKVAAKTVFYLFGEVLPMTQDEQFKQVQEVLNCDLATFMKQMTVGLAISGMMPQNWDTFLKYMQFMRDGCNHILDPEKFPLPTVYKTSDNKMTIDPDVLLT